MDSAGYEQWMYLTLELFEYPPVVPDLMNNTIGAMIGGLIAVAVISGTQRHKDIHILN